MIARRSSPIERYGVHVVLSLALLVAAFAAPSHSPDRTDPLTAAGGLGAFEDTISPAGAASELATPDPGAVDRGVTEATGPATVLPEGGGDGTTDPAGSAGPVEAGPDAAAEVAVDCSRQRVLGPLVTCKPLFEGSNGGATYQGVTEDEIVFVSYSTPGDPVVDSVLQQSNLAATPEEADRVTRAWIEWFQRNFQTYGRTVRYVNFQGEATDAAGQRAEAVRIAQEIGAFVVATATGGQDFIDEIARRGVICLCGVQLPGRFHRERAPFVLGLLPDGDTTNSHVAEYIAKRLGTEPAVHAGEGVRGKPRVYGVVHPNDNLYKDNADDLRGRLAAQGIQVAAAVGYASDINTAVQQATNVVQQLKAAGVTSVLCVCDPVAPYFLYQAATAQRYFPEHIMTGFFFQDVDFVARLYDQNQMAHAFGISHLNPPEVGGREDAPSVKAYREIHPDGPEPSPILGANFFIAQAVFTMVELAGPQLDPTTAHRGLLSIPRERAVNKHDVAFFFTERSFGGIQDAREVWWDRNGRDPDGNRGMFQSVADGWRYLLGEWPTSPTRAFDPACLSPGACGAPSW